MEILKKIRVFRCHKKVIFGKWTFSWRSASVIIILLIANIHIDITNGLRVARRCPYGNFYTDGCVTCTCSPETGQRVCENMISCPRKKVKCPMGVKYHDECQNECTCYESTGAIFCKEKGPCNSVRRRNTYEAKNPPHLRDFVDRDHHDRPPDHYSPPPPPPPKPKSKSYHQTLNFNNLLHPDRDPVLTVTPSASEEFHSHPLLELPLHHPSSGEFSTHLSHVPPPVSIPKEDLIIEPALIIRRKSFKNGKSKMKFGHNLPKIIHEGGSSEEDVHFHSHARSATTLLHLYEKQLKSMKDFKKYYKHYLKNEDHEEKSKSESNLSKMKIIHNGQTLNNPNVKNFVLKPHQWNFNKDFKIASSSSKPPDFHWIFKDVHGSTTTPRPKVQIPSTFEITRHPLVTYTHGSMTISTTTPHSPSSASTTVRNYTFLSSTPINVRGEDQFDGASNMFNPHLPILRVGSSSTPLPPTPSPPLHYLPSSTAKANSIQVYQSPDPSSKSYYTYTTAFPSTTFRSVSPSHSTMLLQDNLLAGYHDLLHNLNLTQQYDTSQNHQQDPQQFYTPAPLPVPEEPVQIVTHYAPMTTPQPTLKSFRLSPVSTIAPYRVQPQHRNWLSTSTAASVLQNSYRSSTPTSALRRFFTSTFPTSTFRSTSPQFSTSTQRYLHQQNQLRQQTRNHFSTSTTSTVTPPLMRHDFGKQRPHGGHGHIHSNHNFHQNNHHHQQQRNQHTAATTVHTQLNKPIFINHLLASKKHPEIYMPPPHPETRRKQYRLILKNSNRPQFYTDRRHPVPSFVDKLAREFFRKPQIYVPNIRKDHRGHQKLELRRVYNHKEMIPQELILNPGGPPMKVKFSEDAEREMEREWNHAVKMDQALGGRHPHHEESYHQENHPPISHEPVNYPHDSYQPPSYSEFPYPPPPVENQPSYPHHQDYKEEPIAVIGTEPPPLGGDPMSYPSYDSPPGSGSMDMSYPSYQDSVPVQTSYQTPVHDYSQQPQPSPSPTKYEVEIPQNMPSLAYNYPQSQPSQSPYPADSMSSPYNDQIMGAHSSLPSLFQDPNYRSEDYPPEIHTSSHISPTNPDTLIVDHHHQMPPDSDASPSVEPHSPPYSVSPRPSFEVPTEYMDDFAHNLGDDTLIIESISKSHEVPQSSNNHGIFDIIHEKVHPMHHSTPQPIYHSSSPSPIYHSSSPPQYPTHHSPSPPQYSPHHSTPAPHHSPYGYSSTTPPPPSSYQYQHQPSIPIRRFDEIVHEVGGTPSSSVDSYYNSIPIRRFDGVVPLPATSVTSRTTLPPPQKDEIDHDSLLKELFALDPELKSHSVFLVNQDGTAVTPMGLMTPQVTTPSPPATFYSSTPHQIYSSTAATTMTPRILSKKEPQLPQIKFKGDIGLITNPERNLQNQASSTTASTTMRPLMTTPETEFEQFYLNLFNIPQDVEMEHANQKKREEKLSRKEPDALLDTEGVAKIFNYDKILKEFESGDSPDEAAARVLDKRAGRHERSTTTEKSTKKLTTRTSKIKTTTKPTTKTTTTSTTTTTTEKPDNDNPASSFKRELSGLMGDICKTNSALCLTYKSLSMLMET